MWSFLIFQTLFYIKIVRRLIGGIWFSQQCCGNHYEGWFRIPSDVYLSMSKEPVIGARFEFYGRDAKNIHETKEERKRRG